MQQCIVWFSCHLKILTLIEIYMGWNMAIYCYKWSRLTVGEMSYAAWSWLKHIIALHKGFAPSTHRERDASTSCAPWDRLGRCEDIVRALTGKTFNSLRHILGQPHSAPTPSERCASALASPLSVAVPTHMTFRSMLAFISVTDVNTFFVNIDSVTLSFVRVYLSFSWNMTRIIN